MGAYAPAPVCSLELAGELTQMVLQRAVDGMRAEGSPFCGVFYAGLMLTADGPRVLEFNCRFGDPETQVIMPLLDTDLLDIAEACADGGLDAVNVRWKSGAAACVVLASEGYPGSYPSNRPISGLDSAGDEAVVFHAGTKLSGSRIVTAGGRVLGVVGLAEEAASADKVNGKMGTEGLARAIETTYRAVEKIHFEGMQYRKDIGSRIVRDAR
jgi:phosphoribosylamine--glycine ligase